MSDINKLFITGRLTKDAEVSVLQNGSKVTRFDVANSTGYNENEQTNFFKVSMFGNYGEALAPHLGKGVQVMIEGMITVSNTKDNNGNYRTYVNVKADHVVIGKEPSGRSQSIGTSYKPEVHDMGMNDESVQIDEEDLPF